METFIDSIVREVKNKFEGDYRKLCIIFPTRRACLIFRKQLAASHQKPVWAPGVMAIGDFVSRHVQVKVEEEIPILLALFEVYKKYWPGQDFGKFYPWGQMLINDFDEIDKQLGDPSRIFANISEIKKIEAAFLPDEESIKWIEQFVASFNAEQMTKLQSEFSKTWNRLGSIYSEFNAILTNRSIAYEGRAYRELISSLKKPEYKSKWEHFAFAGFYGFSRAEEEVIRLLQKKKKVHLYWDADNYFIDNTNHEAGYYFRKTSLYDLNIRTEHFKNSKKKIEISGIPLQAGQAKYMGQVLEKLLADNQFDINTTAVVLADENMLFPVLYSIPEAIDPVNVTMGYPLKQSQFAGLIQLLYDLHKHKKINSSGDICFYHRYVMRLMQHPLISQLTERANKNSAFDHIVYQDAEYINSTYGFSFSQTLFSDIKSALDLFEYMEAVFILILAHHSQKSNNVIHIEDRIINFIVSELNLLRKHLETNLQHIDLNTAWQLIKECVTALKVPFSGEPVKGLQVMGFLETRALDFKTIIFLNVNEGILPSTGSQKSFIPYSLRKGFGLPTYEDQDASYSYHFYRLLQKAENIFLIYNTEAGNTGGGEPSRFILQILHELKKFMGDNLELNFKTIATPIIPEIPEQIIIHKNSEILIELDKYKLSYEGDKKRSFSSSALTTYMNCSLQFYFRYIAGLREKDDIAENIEADIFGNIIHHALELIYIKAGEHVTAEKIEQLLLISDAEVENAFRKIYKSDISQLEGNDILLAEVISELVKRILINDKSDAPFEIIGLESQFEGIFSFNNNAVRLYGKFDRVDQRNGETRIIDYKTGKVELKFKSLEQLFTDPRKKTLFQLYFYAFVYRLKHPGKPVKAGFYIARQLGSGISWPEDGKPVKDEIFENFSKMLEALINEILNPETHFTKTPFIERCKFCEFKSICHR